MASKPQLKVLMDLSDGLIVNETSDLCFDISDIVMTANTRRGRNREIDKIQAGYAVITVIDENGDFNPDNTASPYYGKLIPGKKLRLYPLYDDGTGEFRYPDIFTGYITNYATQFSMGVNEANKIVIEAYDGMKIFNSVSITNVTNSTSGDFSDERIQSILDEDVINWPSELTTLETSAIELDADQGELRTVLDALRQVEDTEAGLIYFDGSGVLQFKNRAKVNQAPDIENAYKFSDNGIDTSYNDIKFIQDDATLINKITVISYNGSNEATAYNSTSQDTYFVRSAERLNVLLSATTDLQDLADTLLANYEDSTLQIERIILNLNEYEEIDKLIAAFFFEIFFIPISVEKLMPGNTSISRLGWIQGVNHDITPNSWLVTAFTGLTDSYSEYFILNVFTQVSLWTGMGVDSDFNIYAETDKVLDGFGNPIDCVIKIDVNGNLIWQKRYISGGSVPIIVGNDNNLYLRGPGTSFVKVDSDGNVISAVSQNFRTDAKIASDGIIYYIDNSYNIGKVDSSLVPVWGIELYPILLLQIALYENNLYWTGFEQNAGMAYIGGCDTNGNNLWAFVFEYDGNNAYFGGLAIDSNGKIYVTVVTELNYGSNGIVTILKLEYVDSDLNIIWQKKLDEFEIDNLATISIDFENNVYFTVQNAASPYNDYMIKLDTNGNLLLLMEARNSNTTGGNNNSKQKFMPVGNRYVFGIGNKSFYKLPNDSVIEGTFTINSQEIEFTDVTQTAIDNNWFVTGDISFGSHTLSTESFELEVDAITITSEVTSYADTYLQIP